MPKRKKTHEEKWKASQAWKKYKETRTPEQHEKDKERIRNAVRRYRASGKDREYAAKFRERRRRIAKNKKYLIEIDGKELWEENRAAKSMLKIKYSTYASYRSRGVIPEPIYHKAIPKPWGDQLPYTRKYLSKRQIALLNRTFGKTYKNKSLGWKSEYLFSKWTKDEVGFGGEDADGGKDSKQFNKGGKDNDG